MKDRKGLRSGKLVLQQYAGPGGRGVGSYWIARCDCGNYREILAKEAARGSVRSCGHCDKMPMCLMCYNPGEILERDHAMLCGDCYRMRGPLSMIGLTMKIRSMFHKLNSRNKE